MGSSDYLKENIGKEVYRLHSLAAGLFMDNIQIAKITNFPVYELMIYLNVKYQNNFEQINEEDLANQISYWFYTTLIVPSKLNTQGKKSSLEIKQWKKIINGDGELKKSYYDFVDEAIKFYNTRFQKIKKLQKIWAYFVTISSICSKVYGLLIVAIRSMLFALRCFFSSRVYAVMRIIFALGSNCFILKNAS